ncbi:MAG: hypothetical protein GX025_10320 [Clostridiales bacterium]|nr:hypothetical protein [Clostridiales bacterium]
MTKKREFILNPITPLKNNSQRLVELYLTVDKDETKRLIKVIYGVNEDVIRDLKTLLDAEDV